MQVKILHCIVVIACEYLSMYLYFFQSPPEKTKQAVLTAVRAGYRFIDCANDYDNEHVIGEALQELFKEGVVKRSDLFIQVKFVRKSFYAGVDFKNSNYQNYVIPIF